MGRWKVTMPRDNPPEGEVDYRIGLKCNDGFRVELDGRITDETFRKVARILQKEAVPCPRNQI
jgi:hypothetical protein